MPLYSYKCENGHSFDRVLRLADYEAPQECECGATSKRQICATMIAPDMQNWDRYISPASGKMITSYREREADMKATGCVDYDPGVKTDSTNNMKRSEAKLEKAMDDTVEQTISEMPVRKREKLTEELNSGAEVGYERI